MVELFFMVLECPLCHDLKVEDEHDHQALLIFYWHHIHHRQETVTCKEGQDTIKKVPKLHLRIVLDFCVLLEPGNVVHQQPVHRCRKIKVTVKLGHMTVIFMAHKMDKLFWTST